MNLWLLKSICSFRQDIGDLEFEKLLSDTSDNQSTKLSSTLDKTSSSRLPSSPDTILVPKRSILYKYFFTLFCSCLSLIN